MTLASIAEQVQGLTVLPDADELRMAFAVRDQLDARIALAVADFDDGGGYELDGALTTKSWLVAHAGRDPLSAKKAVDTGRKLKQLPVLRDAALTGAVSGGQLDIILAHVPKRHVRLFAAHSIKWRISSR